MPLGDAPDFGTPSIDPFWTIAIVTSTWHSELTTAMRDHAVAELVQQGIQQENIGLFRMPGTFELPLACQKALERYDAVIAFGVVVQGQTHHARLVAEQAAAGLMQVQLTTRKPVTFEVLYVEDYKDAEKRAIGSENKGLLAAQTVLTSLARMKEIQ